MDPASPPVVEAPNPSAFRFKLKRRATVESVEVPVQIHLDLDPDGQPLSVPPLGRTVFE